MLWLFSWVAEASEDVVGTWVDSPQRARVLAEIGEHLAGPLTQEEQWYWEAQRDWWYTVP